LHPCKERRQAKKAQRENGRFSLSFFIFIYTIAAVSFCFDVVPCFREQALLQESLIEDLLLAVQHQKSAPAYS